MHALTWLIVFWPGVVDGLAARPAAVQKQPPPLLGPRYVAYDHNSVIHLFDRRGELKPTSKKDDHPHIPEHYTFCLHPALSAQADYVAFSSLRPMLEPGLHSLDIYVWERATKKVLSLPGANSFAHDDYPSISADGNLIAFHTVDEKAFASAGIRLYDRKAGRLVELPNLELNTNTGIPCLSPDGRFIAFSARTSKGDRDIFLYDRQAKKLLDLPHLNTAEDEWSARISRGGRWIACCSRGAKGAAVILCDRDTRKRQELSELSPAAKELECDLSADGRFVAVLVNRAELRLYDRDTGKQVPLPGLYHQGRIQFSPALSRE